MLRLSRLARDASEALLVDNRLGQRTAAAGRAVRAALGTSPRPRVGNDSWNRAIVLRVDIPTRDDQAMTSTRADAPRAS